jgi:gas vesicle protein
MFVLIVWATGVSAQPSANFYAAPETIDNPECSLQRPCSPQGAFRACRSQLIENCVISLTDGVYDDPEINIYYYRLVQLTGNCSNPNAVVLRATKDNTTLIWIQDHAIGIIECMTLDSTAKGTIAIAGRQHVIIDYKDIVFGETNGGHHLSMTEYSIASCVGRNTISGGAHIHAGVSDMSKLNMSCQWHLSAPAHFNYFYSAVDFSKIDAGRATYTGDVAESTGTKCNASNSSIDVQVSALPGDRDGKCSRSELHGLRSEIDIISSTLHDLRSQMNTEINAIQSEMNTEINAIRSEMNTEINAIRSEMNTEINAIRSEIDDVQHAQNGQRRLDRAIIAAVALMLVLVAGAAYYRLRTLKK